MYNIYTCYHIYINNIVDIFFLSPPNYKYILCDIFIIVMVSDNVTFMFKIIIVGDYGVGKSSFMHKYMSGIFYDTHMSTIGLDFHIKPMHHNNEHINLRIWDTGGQERFRSIISTYFRGAHAVILCFDVTNLLSFDNLCQWIDFITKHSNGDVQIFIVGNKIDLEHQRVITSLDAKQFAANFEYPYVEISALNNTTDDIDNVLFRPLLDILLSKFEDERINPHKTLHDNICIRTCSSMKDQFDDCCDGF